MSKLQAGDVIQILKKKDGVSVNKCYLITQAKMGGGGTGHGPHDVFPDGWLLTLSLLGKSMIWSQSAKIIHLYQDGFGGCFTDTVVLKDDEFAVVAKMEINWKLVSMVHSIKLKV